MIIIENTESNQHILFMLQCMLGDIDDPIMHCTFIITIVNIHTLIIDICVCLIDTVIQIYIVCRSLKIITMMELM